MIVDKLLAYFGIDVDERGFADAKQELNKIEAAAQDVIDTVVSIKSAFAGAFVAAVGMTNAQTAAEVKQSEAMGLTFEKTKALANALKGTGLQFENVTDLAEELSNKMGESMGVEEMTAVKEAFGMLGLEFNKMKLLPVQQQMDAIFRSAMKMQNQQKARAAVDMLLGGEGNKVVGQMRLISHDYDELINQQQRYMFNTEEGAKGAVQFANSWNRLATVTSSLWEDVAGVIGTAMAPAMDAISDFIAGFREFYQLNVKEHIGGITTAVQVLGVALTAGVIGKFVKLGAAAVSAAGSVGLIRGAVIGIRAALGGVLALFGGPVGLAITGVLLLVEDLYYYFNGMPSLIGGIGDAFNTYVRPKVEEFTNWFGGKVQAILDMIPQGLKDALFPGGGDNKTASVGSYAQGGGGGLMASPAYSAPAALAMPIPKSDMANLAPKFDVIIQAKGMYDVMAEVKKEGRIENAITYRYVRKNVDY